MVELRDKLLERAGDSTRLPSEVKDLVEAALQLDMHIRQEARDEKAETHYFGLTKRVDDLEKATKKGKAKKA